MFGFLKLSGAPPRAFMYYRQVTNYEEKVVMEDLYKRLSGFIKQREKEVRQEAKLELPNQSESIREFRNRQEATVLFRAFDDMARYGNEKGYPEFLISLFYPREIFRR